jgi:hypothetical protein
MAEPKRMTTASFDPVARAKFEEEMKRLGRPFIPRRSPQTPGRQPSMWIQIMATLDSALANIQRSLMGGRLVGPNAGSGYGGRERAYAIDETVTQIETGQKKK